LFTATSISYFDSKVLAKAGYAVVYVIGYEGDGEGDPVKVGTATDVYSRLSNFQTGSWRPISVKEMFFFKSRLGAVMERRMRDARYNDDNEAIAEIIAAHESSNAPHILELERISHQLLTDQGLHHFREWFNGGYAKVIDLMRAEFERRGFEFDNCRSMMRRLKMWKTEAEITPTRKRVRAA